MQLRLHLQMLWQRTGFAGGVDAFVEGLGYLEIQTKVVGIHQSQQLVTGGNPFPEIPGALADHTVEGRGHAVAPGPVWTPLIPASFDAEKTAHFGGQVPMDRPAQPSEIGPAYVYLACEESSYMSGQTLHLNGGVILNT